MSNEIDSVFDSSTESSYYIQGENATSNEKPKFIPAVPGTYLGHVVEMRSDVYDVLKGQHKARIYNFYIELASENEGKKVTVNNKKVDCKEFVGRKFRSDGVFRYLEPGAKDTFTSRADGNKGYLKFCEALNIECKESEKELSNGEKVKIKQLPTITEEDVLGKPVEIVLTYGKPYKNNKGYEVTPLVVKYFNKWDNGPQKEISKVDLNEIPF